MGNISKMVVGTRKKLTWERRNLRNSERRERIDGRKKWGATSERFQLPRTQSSGPEMGGVKSRTGRWQCRPGNESKRGARKCWTGRRSPRRVLETYWAHSGGKEE